MLICKTCGKICKSGAGLKSHINWKHNGLSEEERKKILKKQTGQFKKGNKPKFTPETRRKISETMKKRIAESKEWQKSLKKRGEKSQFKKGYDKRRFAKRNWTPEALKKISDATKQLSNRRRGKEHHAWKGGITPEHNKIRNSVEYRNWRDLVYKRDHWTCQNCGIHCNPRDIVAHHIKSFADYIELRFDINNGITYCRKCHNLYPN